MGQPFVGEIRMFGGSFAPLGWALCQGQTMAISENEVLFSLIGTTYGGDGQETFCIPDLCGRVPMHQGQGPGLSQNYQIGEMGGVESVTLTTQQIPNHTHTPLASDSPAAGRKSSPKDATWGNNGQAMYSSAAPSHTMRANMITPSGGSQPHDNMQPYLVISFIISLYGIYPHQ